MKEKIDGGGLYRNTVSYFGGLVILVSLVLILLFLLLSFSLKQPSPYIGIFTYMIFTVFLILGVVIFLYGLFGRVGDGAVSGLKSFCPILYWI
jgi:hypothetical protein